MTTKFVSETVYADFEFNDSIDVLIKELNTMRETAMNRGMIDGTSTLQFNRWDGGTGGTGYGYEIVLEFKRKETDAERTRREKFEAAKTAKLAEANTRAINAERAEYERLKAKFG